ncbi:MAG: ornithine carbamoyltransferase [Actinomycetota bacterium]|nr:ornithine carbamoyltransferase [Actinomycetota bacterium]
MSRPARSLLSIADLSREELLAVLDLAEAPLGQPLLAGKGVALVFEHPSARTRNACEMAVVQLGGHPLAIRGEEIGIDRRETAEDVARTLACFHSVVTARVARHSTLERMRRAVEEAGRPVPIVNLLSDWEHPTQALADVLTVRQRLGRLEGVTITYVGDANNVCRSLVGAAALCGMRPRVAAPDGYSLEERDLEWVRALGGEVELFSNPREAVVGAEVLYTDVWVSMGQDAEGEARRRALARFRIDEELVALAAPGAVVLHCLPAHRGEEISAAVLDGAGSAVWQQAENRMHSLRGLLRFLLGEGAGHD